MSGRPRLTLVLGGARSGKSRHAEALARETGLRRIYLATAEAFDDEMRQRIAAHRADRAADGWSTVEEPLEVAAAVYAHAATDAVLLVDCLTLWLSNTMLAERDVAAGAGRCSPPCAPRRGLSSSYPTRWALESCLRHPSAGGSAMRRVASTRRSRRRPIMWF